MRTAHAHEPGGSGASWFAPAGFGAEPHMSLPAGDAGLGREAPSAA
jgi:hypothetical protein